MPRGSGRSAQRCFARAALAALGALAACRGGGEPLQIASARVATPVREAPATRLPRFGHIFVIVMENKEASEVVGDPDAPYLNALAARYARAGNFYATRHPSLPNYLALTGGDTFGITKNCRDCFLAVDNLASQIETAGRSWKAYMEAMPEPCFVGNASPYAQRHNPFIYYDNLRTDPARCRKIVPFDRFGTDLEQGALPDFVWITPDTCHDMHSCSVATGDGWLRSWVPRILASPAWQDGGVLFITWDEGHTDAGCCTHAAGGKVDTLVVSPLARPGFTSLVPYDHYSLLRSIEEAWGLPLLGHAGCDCTRPMDDFFEPPEGGRS